MSRPLRPVLVVLALLAAFALPLTAAGPSRAAGAQATSSSATAGLAAQLWTWLRAIRPDLGCTSDPDGCAMRPTPGRAAPPAGKARPDLGCTSDPSGGCAMRPTPGRAARRQARPDLGCRADPNGGCR
jgi:hypothetical protein